MASANLIHRFEAKLDAQKSEMATRFDAQKSEMAAQLGAQNTQLRFIKWGIGIILGLITAVGVAVSILVTLPQ